MNVGVVSPSASKSPIAAQNYFELFGLPKRFEVDLPALEQAYLTVQHQVHPDRHASADDAQKRVALQLATYANSAYQTLRHPLKRGFYLCELAGLDPQLETNTAMPAEFLVQQMEWREAKDDAQDNVAALENLMKDVLAAKKEYVQAISHLFDESQDMPAALEKLRAALFIERFEDELDQAIADLV